MLFLTRRARTSCSAAQFPSTASSPKLSTLRSSPILKATWTPGVLANNVEIGLPTSEGPQTVASGDAVALTTNFQINGTDITHTPGSTDVVLAGDHQYFVVYTTAGTYNAGNTHQMGLRLNGAFVGGSSVNQQAALGPIGFCSRDRDSHCQYGGPWNKRFTSYNIAGTSVTLQQVKLTIVQII